MAQSYINGRAYDASQAQVKLASMSQPFAGLLSMKYKETDEMEQNYGIGRRPVSYGYGNIKVEASITISYEEYRKLINSSPNRRVQDRPLEDLIITLNHPEADKIITDVVRSIKFMDAPTEINQNDKQFAVELPIMASEIVYG